MSAPKPEMLEKIVAAAIKVGPVVHTGPHHATIIHQIVACGGETPVRGEQGFVTSDGRFVGRGEALAVAIHAGQVDFQLRDNIGLMSENLWTVPEPNWEALRASEASVESLTEEFKHCAAMLAQEERAVESLRKEVERLHASLRRADADSMVARAEATKAEADGHDAAVAAWEAGWVACEAFHVDEPPDGRDRDEFVEEVKAQFFAAIRAPRPPEPEISRRSPSSPTPPTSPDEGRYLTTHLQWDGEIFLRCKACGYSWESVVYLKMACPAVPAPTPPSEGPMEEESGPCCEDHYADRCNHGIYPKENCWNCFPSPEPPREEPSK